MSTSYSMTRAAHGEGLGTAPDHSPSQVGPSQFSCTGMSRLNVESHQPVSARVQKMQTLVSEMKNRAMSFNDIQRLLRFSDSGARNYVSMLNKCGILEVCGGGDAKGHNLRLVQFRVTADPEQLEKGFAALDESVKEAASKSNAAAKRRLGRDEAGNERRFHILADDETFTVKISRHKPARDPLVAALFGPAAPTTAAARKQAAANSLLGGVV